MGLQPIDSLRLMTHRRFPIDLFRGVAVCALTLLLFLSGPIARASAATTTITGYLGTAYRHVDVTGDRNALSSDYEVELTTGPRLELGITGFGWLENAHAFQFRYDRQLPVDERFRLHLEGPTLSAVYDTQEATLGKAGAGVLTPRTLRGLWTKIDARTGTAHLISADVRTVWTEELLIGDGTEGPYVLSHGNLLEGSLRLRRRGRLLVPTVDYDIDYDTGGVTFATPLLEHESVTAVYEYWASKPRRLRGGSLRVTTDGTAPSLSLAYAEETPKPSATDEDSLVFLPSDPQDEEPTKESLLGVGGTFPLIPNLSLETRWSRHRTTSALAAPPWERTTTANGWRVGILSDLGRWRLHSAIEVRDPGFRVLGEVPDAFGPLGKTEKSIEIRYGGPAGPGWLLNATTASDPAGHRGDDTLKAAVNRVSLPYTQNLPGRHGPLILDQVTFETEREYEKASTDERSTTAGARWRTKSGSWSTRLWRDRHGTDTAWEASLQGDVEPPSSGGAPRPSGELLPLVYRTYRWSLGTVQKTHIADFLFESKEEDQSQAAIGDNKTVRTNLSGRASLPKRNLFETRLHFGGGGVSRRWERLVRYEGRRRLRLGSDAGDPAGLFDWQGKLYRRIDPGGAPQEESTGSLHLGWEPANGLRGRRLEVGWEQKIASHPASRVNLGEMGLFGRNPSEKQGVEVDWDVRTWYVKPSQSDPVLRPRLYRSWKWTVGNGLSIKLSGTIGQITPPSLLSMAVRNGIALGTTLSHKGRSGAAEASLEWKQEVPPGEAPLRTVTLYVKAESRGGDGSTTFAGSWERPNFSGNLAAATKDDTVRLEMRRFLGSAWEVTATARSFVKSEPAYNGQVAEVSLIRYF